jgi:pimeloyl-ACP methyl ester carboxylesterase
MPYAKRADMSLYYEQDGSGDPPILFIPGWCCDTTFFQPQYDHFRAAHRVAAFDPRGCGRSDRPDDGYDLATQADDIAWLCGEIGISRPVVVGHSLGAMVAIEFAARHPALPRAIIAADPGPIDPLPETRRVFEKFVADMEGPDGEAARRAWVEAGAESADGADRRHHIVETMCGVPLRLAAAAIRGVIEWTGPAALAACKVPTLVLRSVTGGSNDPARLLPHKPDLHFGMTVGAGHFHQLDVPEQVIPMMERFIRVTLAEPRD